MQPDPNNALHDPRLWGKEWRRLSGMPDDSADWSFEDHSWYLDQLRMVAQKLHILKAWEMVRAMTEDEVIAKINTVVETSKDGRTVTEAMIEKRPRGHIWLQLRLQLKSP